MLVWYTIAQVSKPSSLSFEVKPGSFKWDLKTMVYVKGVEEFILPAYLCPHGTNLALQQNL